MGFKDSVRKIVYAPVFDFIIVSIIIISTIVLMLEKIFSFNADVRSFLDIFDLVILSIFLVEFVIKMILDGKEYFIKKYGWIDMIATLPILVPILNFIILHFYVNFVLTKAATSTLSGMRIFRILRVVRVIRIVRVLKVLYHAQKYSGSEETAQESSLTVPALSVLLFVILSYIVVVYQENRTVNYITRDKTMLLNLIMPENIDDIFVANQNILILYKDNEVKRRISDKDLKYSYSNDEYVYITDKNQNFMVVSIREQKDLLKFHELFIIIIEIMMILSFLIYSRKPVVLKKKGA